MSVFRGTFLKTVSERRSNITVHLSEIVRALNAVVEFISPKPLLADDERNTVALNPSLTSTIILNPKFTSQSILIPVARSASAASAPIWVVAEKGKITINHDASAITTRLIRYIVL